jgi:type IV secretion system protein VirD4
MASYRALRQRRCTNDFFDRIPDCSEYEKSQSDLRSVHTSAPEPMEKSMESQDRIEPKPLLLGRTYQTPPRNEDRRVSNGSRKMPPLSVPIGGDVFTLEVESHLLTIGPTGSGKGRSCIIPNLLTYPGQVVVIDPKGEAYAVTARARRAMGHTVVRLDPFRVIDQESDALNPLELVLGLEKAKIETACQDVADLLPLRNSFTDVWENAAFGLLSGVIGYLAVVPEKQKFADLYMTFHSDDVVYNLAVMLDTIGKRIPPMSYAEISAFLQKADAERSRILTAITSHLKAMGSQEVQTALGRSSVPLTDIIEGKPVTVYVIIPPAKLPANFSLLRLWIGTLLHCVTSRRARPAQPTLFLLDECAQLGSFPQLETAITSCGGSGLRVWTFWHDLSQLRGLYPAGWPTMLNSCGAVQVFGAKDYSASSEAAAAFGVEAEDVRLLAADEQIVCRDGVAHRIRKLDYLADPLFAGRFDDNPLHASPPKG